MVLMDGNMFCQLCSVLY